MWIVELNVFGRKFTRQVSDRPKGLRVTPHNVQTRLSQLRHPKAAF